MHICVYKRENYKKCFNSLNLYMDISVLLIIGYIYLFNRSSLIIMVKNYNSNINNSYSIANEVLHLILFFITIWI